jgi:hypothetical protein
MTPLQALSLNSRLPWALLRLPATLISFLKLLHHRPFVTTDSSVRLPPPGAYYVSTMSTTSFSDYEKVRYLRQ